MLFKTNSFASEFLSKSIRSLNYVHVVFIFYFSCSPASRNISPLKKYPSLILWSNISSRICNTTRGYWCMCKVVANCHGRTRHSGTLCAMEEIILVDYAMAIGSQTRATLKLIFPRNLPKVATKPRGHRSIFSQNRAIQWLIFVVA